MFTASSDDSVKNKPVPRGKKAKAKIAATMDEYGSGTLKSGSGASVTNPKQAVAIALSQARKAQK